MEEYAAPSVRGSHPHATAPRTLDELPGPRGLPILGNALDLKPKELHRLVTGWADQFGPLFVVSRPKDARPLEDIYNFTVGPTNVYAILRPRRPIRGGIDIELRDGNRRMFVVPIAFPERRVGDRHEQHAATVA